MVKINYWYPDGSYEQRTADTLAAELAARYPSGVGVPSGMRICRDGVDITLDLLSDESPAHSRVSAVYDITIPPGDPLTAVIVLVSVVIAVVSMSMVPKIAAPTNANRNQQSPNNSLSNRSNVPRVNQRDADIRGYVAGAYFDLLQLPYRKFDAGTEYEVIYAKISDGDVLVERVRDGDTLLSKIQGAGGAIYGPNTSPLSGAPLTVIGQPPTDSLYTVVQSNEVDGVILKAPNVGGLGETTTITADVAGLITATGTGIDFTTWLEVGINVTLSGFNVFYETGDPLEYFRNDISGSYEITGLTATTINIAVTPTWTDAFISVTGPQLMRGTVWQQVVNPDIFYFSDPGGGLAYPTTFSPTINGVGSSNNSVGPVVASGYDRIWINIVARNGLYKDDGEIITPSIDAVISVRVRQTTESGSFTGTQTENIYTIPPNAADPKQSTGLTIDLPVPYEYADVVVTRIGNTDTTFSGTVSDEIQWRDLYLVDNVTTIDATGSTTIHAQIRATESALRVKDRKLNADVTRIVPTYSGTFSDPQPRKRFADVLASICRDPLFGRMSDDEVDWQQLYDMQADMIAYYGSDEPLWVGYTFDSDTITAEDAIRMICDAVNVRPYRIGSVLNFWFEGPQTASAMQLGHRNKHPGSDKRIRAYGPAQDKTGVELTYYNATERSFDVIKLGSDVNPLRIELSACITKNGATIRANREYRKLQYSRIQHQCDATGIGRLLAPGMRVDVVDNTRTATYDGEVKAVSGLTLTISQPVVLTTPSDYTISMTRADGTLQTANIVAQPAPNQVTISAPLIEAPYVGRDADRTPYVIGTDDMRTRLAMIVQNIEPSGADKISLSLINYSDEYYADDVDGGSDISYSVSGRSALVLSGRGFCSSGDYVVAGYVAEGYVE